MGGCAFDNGDDAESHVLALISESYLEGYALITKLMVMPVSEQ